MTIPNNIIYHQGNNPTLVSMMLDNEYYVYGGQGFVPEGGIRDYKGGITLRQAIYNQSEDHLTWMHVVEWRFETPFIMAEYVDSTWHFYPEGLPIYA